jgi:hypothetical protein
MDLESRHDQACTERFGVRPKPERDLVAKIKDARLSALGVVGAENFICAVQAAWWYS